ncbi:MEDS domain-containing protein [Variovorax paradoxus]|nr:MEDS domain-containing protein [Variovorax paradoxus]
MQFYEDEAYLAGEASAFLRAAIDQGGRSLVLATPSHRAAIRSRVLNGLPKGTLRNRLVLLDASDVLARIRNRGGRVDRARVQRVIGGLLDEAACDGPLRVYGELVALLCEEGRHTEAVRLENLWNELARTRRFELFCGYPMAAFARSEDARAFRQVCHAHTHVAPAESANGLRCADGTALAVLQQQARSVTEELARRSEAEGALRAHEQDLARLLREAPVPAALMLGPQHRFELVNDAFRDLFGQEVLEGRAYRETFPARAHADIARIFDRAFATGEPCAAEEYALQLHRDRAAGHFLKLSVQPLRRASGDVYGLMAIAVDVTDLVNARRNHEHARAEREALLKHLEAANRTKDEFLAMLGHELRNPLAPIVTALHLMKRRGDIKTSREQEIIHRQVRHLTRLLDDLLDVSRITRGKIVLRPETVELGEVLARAVEMASLLIEQREQALEVDCPASGLPWRGDATRLAQVFSNLLTNAARYTPPGGRIRIDVRREGQGAEISVKDNGRGISAQMLPRVFDLFYQGPQNLERAEGGLGVGLALVKALVEMHGGSVDARSDGPGSGSEFVVRLPLAADAGADAPVPVPCATRQAKAECLRRVLIVDDNKDAADMLGELVAHGGHEVRVVYDPASALDLAQSFAPEVAILDIGLPVMDGYELALQLRRELMDAGRRLRVFSLTGFGQPADGERSRLAGLDGHFVKPVDPEAVLQAVENNPPSPEAEPPGRSALPLRPVVGAGISLAPG